MRGEHTRHHHAIALAVDRSAHLCVQLFETRCLSGLEHAILRIEQDEWAHHGVWHGTVSHLEIPRILV